MRVDPTARPVILGFPDHESSKAYMRHHEFIKVFDANHGRVLETFNQDGGVPGERHPLEFSRMPNLEEAVRHDRQMFRTRHYDRYWRDLARARGED